MPTGTTVPPVTVTHTLKPHGPWKLGEPAIVPLPVSRPPLIRNWDVAEDAASHCEDAGGQRGIQQHL